MLARIVMVIAIASLALLLGAPEDALACHRGDPHGSAASCDGGGGVTPTNFVLVDGNGDVVGPVISFQTDRGITLTNLQVIASTQDQRLFFLTIDFAVLRQGRGFRPQGQQEVRFENLGCEGAVFFSDNFALPNVFYEVALVPNGTGGLIPFVTTSFEVQFPTIFSTSQGDGSCSDSPTPGVQAVFPAEQLTDEFGDLVS